nr:putative retrotransposon Gag domain, nucleotide-binding alpha-beta plait domain protein [Tanacetum cinerariifolium]
YKRRCCSSIPAKSDSLPHAHTKALKVKHSASRLLLLNKNVFEPGQFEAMANETEKNGASRSVVDENRGRDDARQHPKKRGTSKDVVASLDKRVAGVETSMAELKNQVEGLEGLGSDFESMREDFRVAFNTLSGDLKRVLALKSQTRMSSVYKYQDPTSRSQCSICNRLNGSNGLGY